MSAPPEPKLVGKGLQLKSQADLEGSNHPLSPFVGNALEWSSYVFDDGSTYALLSYRLSRGCIGRLPTYAVCCAQL